VSDHTVVAACIGGWMSGVGARGGGGTVKVWMGVGEEA
jgi:hypothetical protein